MKNSIKISVVVFLILGAIYAATLFKGKPSKSSSLKEELVNISIEDVSRFTVRNNGEVVELKREGGNDWKVSVGDSKWRNAETGQIESAIEALNTIRPDRLISRKKESWNEYQVDSSGMLVQVFNESTKISDLIIGKMGVKAQNQFYSYVRLAEDDDVYAVDNFMGFSIPSDANSYRYQQLIRYVKDSLNSISFELNDSKYNIEKDLNDNWSLDNNLVDSAFMADFLTKSSYKNTDNFYDDVMPEDLNNQIGQIVFKISGSDDVTLSAYLVKGDTVIYSSINPKNIFQDREFYNQIFLDRASFLGD